MCSRNQSGHELHPAKALIGQNGIAKGFMSEFSVYPWKYCVRPLTTPANSRPNVLEKPYRASQGQRQHAGYHRDMVFHSM